MLNPFKATEGYLDFSAPMVEYGPIMHESSRDPSPYRVTLFFGPEPVPGEHSTQACVFNVKKRSWKAGIQVAVEIRTDQLAALRQAIQLDARLEKRVAALDASERSHCEQRIPDLFAQAACWCKLNLQLGIGLSQDNQRLGADELTTELQQAIADRSEWIVTYVLEELDLATNPSFPLRDG